MSDPLPDGSIVSLSDCVIEGKPLTTELACCLACGAVLARDDQMAEIHRALHVLYERVTDKIGLTDEPKPTLQAVPIKWEGDPTDEAEVENGQLIEEERQDAWRREREGNWTAPDPQHAHEFLERALFVNGWKMIAPGPNSMYRRWRYGDEDVDVVVPIVPAAGDYDELIERAETIRRNVHAGVLNELPDYYPAGLVVTPKMADEMKRRGWREPLETITTEDELFTLPDGSIVITKDGKARIYIGSILGPCLRDPRPGEGSIIGHLEHFLPAQLLWRAPEPKDDR